MFRRADEYLEYFCLPHFQAGVKEIIETYLTSAQFQYIFFSVD
jgi:hypothetical protein